ncbi:L-lysine aminotransferase [Mucilaginibacter gotjawali]|uniref:L-lysine aminotransferase n=1 Tax=Mucilaginibacter gotjawali TaxID=1550579 RepID=A0A110B1V8_9SPHI|nr:hypothetical protein [Mucilaginibacter gotjawali]BAU53150.1 L-lysine aminotransferase [Mucilaginibacter gotjawali]
MYNLQVSPTDVQASLRKHVLADGFDLTFDMEKSKGVYIYDSKHDRTLLDFLHASPRCLWVIITLK